MVKGLSKITSHSHSSFQTQCMTSILENNSKANENHGYGFDEMNALVNRLKIDCTFESIYDAFISSMGLGKRQLQTFC